MTPTQNVPEDRIQIGQLRSAYGLNGWLWVYSNTEPMSNIFDYLPWYIETKAGWQIVRCKTLETTWQRLGGQLKRCE